MHLVDTGPDTLGQENRRFAQVALTVPVFLNSVPKSGSHLLQNIVRMFVPIAQQYHRDFIQHGNLDQHRGAFTSSVPLLSWGHLPFSDTGLLATAGVRKLLLVRDPYDWVLARARFQRSDQFSGALDHLKSEQLSAEQLMNLMIVGIFGKMPGLHDYYLHNAAAWLGTDVTLVRFEELVAAASDPTNPEAEGYFRRLLEACGIVMPDDWSERVRVGADPARSGTARQNLSGITAADELPARLPAAQRDLVDFVAPGLRRLLGYGTVTA